jgi:cell division protein FtsB
MHRYLYMYVALAVTGTVLSGQVGAQIQNRQLATGQQPGSAPARLHQRQGSDGPSPAAEYSPLAAEGGYSHTHTSPLEAMVHALNPHNVDLGAMWEARRRAWLENAGANRYFWYSFAATAALILSWFALAWVHTDCVRERRQLAEHAADALRYAEYCKRRAREAISRYNEHVEGCNRVIEAGDSGIATPETANLEDYKREIQRLKGDNTAKTSQIDRLESQLKVKQEALDSFTERMDEAERRIRNRMAAGQENGNAALVERIQRLEAENRRLKQGRPAPTKSAVANDGTGAGEN